MATTSEPPAATIYTPRPRSPYALLVFILAIIVAVAAILSGFGSRWGWWHFGVGFSILRYAAYAGVVVAVLSIISIIVTRLGSGRRGLGFSIAAFVIALLTFLGPYLTLRYARQFPPIHDVTTDTDNPPQFVAIAPIRANAPNPIEYGGPEVAAKQHEAFPDIQPLQLDLPPDQAFQRALDAARDMGWEIVAADPAAGRIEATATTLWYGFKDDVVIRLTPRDGATTLDVRSVSRVGGGDLGVNANRVRDYLEEVQEED
ncbi:MAG TPA: DUF1499 domain-containing protein [Rhodothermales bacterium]|nr:DUF1499 domain-containing protein [Rhodothermales bacterium]